MDHGRRRVWYGVGPTPFEIERRGGDPRGRGALVVVDGAGAPIVAYTVAGPEPEVRVAERVGERLEDHPVATLSRCGEGCSAGTQVALLGGEPLVW